MAELFWALIIAEFFFGNCSLDRPGVDIEVESLSNELRQLARSYGLARNELLLDEGQYLALKFMRTAWAALLRY